MRKSIFLSFFMAFMAMTYISAQDLEKILDKHFKAVGQENLLKVKTIQATGKATMMGMGNPFKMVNKRPDKIQITLEFQGAKIIQSYDGETAWMVNPMMGSADAIVVTGPEANGLKESGDLDGQLWKYREKGHQLELAGTEELEGKETFVLELTKKSGNVDHYYLDKESYLIVKVESPTIANGSEIEIETLLSNYHNVEGYMMPFTITQKNGGQTAMTITIDEVKVNVELDDSIFSLTKGN